jgi:LysM repeat protein
MAARSPARWLAPIALVTAAVAVYAVVSTSINQDGGTAVEHTTGTTSRQTSPAGNRHIPRARTYVVRPGDTLSGISARTGVPLATLQRLNEGLDSRTLRTGQHVKLRP